MAQAVVVAVIKTKTNRAVAALTAAALSLPGLEVSAGSPVTKATANFQYGHYQESDDRMKVQIYHTDTMIPLTERLEFSFSYDRDTYSGASPGWNVPTSMNNLLTTKGEKADVVTAASVVSAGSLTDSENGLAKFEAYSQGGGGAAGYQNVVDQAVPKGTPVVQEMQTQPLETRTQPVMGANYYFADSILGLSGGMSDEPDYQSNFGTISFSHELNEKRTTFSTNYTAVSNTVYRNSGHSHSPPGTGLGHIHPADCEVYACTDYPELHGENFFNSFNLGLSHILSKNTLLNLFTAFTNQAGYLSNPYKTVYVRGEITPDEYQYLSTKANAGDTVDWNAITPLEIVGAELFREVRPEHRNQLSLGTGLIQHIPVLDASTHLNYTFYTDDWQVNSHTFDFKWFQPLPYGFMAAPSVRYYSQSQADFFAPYFLAPRADGHYSSDFRLAAFGSLSTGITLSKEFAKGVKLEAGIEYYTHQSDLRLGGGGSGDYADYNFYLAHGGLTVDLSAPNLFGGGGGHEHHHHHMHHGSQPPAGVMYGHMMPKANDIMVGYRYMYASQAGNMLHGSETVSNAQLAKGASVTVNKPFAQPTLQQVAGLTDGCPGYGKTVGTTFTDFGCLVKPNSMTMGMHMLDIMYAPTDWLNIMVMPQLMDMDMTMSGDLRTAMYDFNGTNSEKHHLSDSYSFYSGMQHNVSDLGDTILMNLFKVYDNPMHHVHVGIGVSAPTGSVSEVHNVLSTVLVKDVPYNVNIKILQDMGMQPGSGTWDFKPNLTYTGQIDQFYWGAQFNSTIRMQDKNSSGYALGDIYQTTSWLGYNLFDWLSASVRGMHTKQNKLDGDIYQVDVEAIPQGKTNQIGHNVVSTVDYPQNYGGQYWDVGFGLNATVTGGEFTGHTFSFEWLQPVSDNVNGYQLERDGALSANWSYMF